MGGWMWGGSDEKDAIRTIHAALDSGINLIDTAPVYGFGRSEKIVGKALAVGGRRKNTIIATKIGLDWADGLYIRQIGNRRAVEWSNGDILSLGLDWYLASSADWQRLLESVSSRSWTRLM
jgi:aryl-alcohol dehydrogenase-like predicted oxidoreductase